MKKLERERRAFITGLGLDLLRVEYRGKHEAYVFEEGVVFCASTPSDGRERANFRSQVRRLGRR